MRVVELEPRGLQGNESQCQPNAANNMQQARTSNAAALIRQTFDISHQTAWPTWAAKAKLASKKDLMVPMSSQ